MFRISTSLAISLTLMAALAYPLGEQSKNLRSSVDIRGIWPQTPQLEIRDGQGVKEMPSVPTADIIHGQGHGVFPCSGEPQHVSAKNCSATIGDTHPTDYGFIPDGGFRQCMKPKSIQPQTINGTCYTKPVKSNKGSEYLDSDHSDKKH